MSKHLALEVFCFLLALISCYAMYGKGRVQYDIINNEPISLNNKIYSCQESNEWLK